MDELEQRQADDESKQLELFRESQRRSREMTREAVAELASVLEPGQHCLPTGTDLFLAAYVVGQAGGIRLRPPPAWREEADRTDPVTLTAAAAPRYAPPLAPSTKPLKPALPSVSDIWRIVSSRMDLILMAEVNRCVRSGPLHREVEETRNGC